MGYELHLRRDDGPIPESQWRHAVEAVDGVRITRTTARTATNPSTGQRISIGVNPLSAEFYFPDNYEEPDLRGRWLPIFNYFQGRISIRAVFDTDNPNDPVRKTLISLAQLTGAKIVSDDGEVLAW